MNNMRVARHKVPKQAKVRLAGSKSITNRALICATLAKGSSEILSPSDSIDTELLLRALSLMGVEIARSTDVIRITGSGLKTGQYTLDLGNAGTTSRFLLALCAASPGVEVVMQGDARLSERPFSELILALRGLGANIEGEQLPLRISGTQLRGGSVQLAGGTSSQFASALLMVTPLLCDPLEIKTPHSQVSAPYLRLTADIMQRFGAAVKADQGTYRATGTYLNHTLIVEPDVSSASYFWGSAALSSTEVTVLNTDQDSLQPDIVILPYLREMGAQVQQTSAGVSVRAGRLQHIEADLTHSPDLAPTLAVLAACAEGTSRLRGLGHLKHKESERLTALSTELSKVGIESTCGADWICIKGGSPTPATISTHNDHRMAMAFAMLATRLPWLEIQNPAVVEKSCANFWTELRKLGILSDL